ncbi:F box and leucine-rich-repeat gene 4 isoform X1 [Rhynchophorus ferrugineus]|uniref:F box and leucine-rich-repeat gene 4 isoform X1 n=1 Tax=Rhynchophorus ferrugineus TaxID=354439 RepID=UPI003FCD8F98
MDGVVAQQFRMTYVEQFVWRPEFSTSKYNGPGSISYALLTLSGRYKKYPQYGDFPECFFFRDYGTWWKEEACSPVLYRPQDEDPLQAQDFIVLYFQIALVPTSVYIYQVYNPGAVIRIWGKMHCGPKWFLLWEGPPRKCKPEAKKFGPPLRNINCLINLLRIEFNHSLLDYHTSIDAVLLTGHQPLTRLQAQIIGRGLANIHSFVPEPAVSIRNDSSDTSGNDYFSMLPNEIILQIFQRLDLLSLSRCSQVSKTWYELSKHGSLYHHISLKPYWNLVRPRTIDYFTDRCTVLKKLDLSWCDQSMSGSILSEFADSLLRLLFKFKDTITHLDLRDLRYIDDDVIDFIVRCTKLVELRLKNSREWTRLDDNFMTSLVLLDLTYTQINDLSLIRIMKANPLLEHLILDQCEGLGDMDALVGVATRYNKKLRTWRSWKVNAYSEDGFVMFTYFPDLEDLDLGWCAVDLDVGSSLVAIAQSCRKLKRLILSAWRMLDDESLAAIIENCKEIRHLDLLGARNISTNVCERALYKLPKLRLLDISYCEGIRRDEVEIWTQQYPHITIQRSYEINDG